MKAYFGRRYRLSASHRLFRSEWDATRNSAAFGKCANPHGHGHNYMVEVLVAGEIDAVTGMVIDLADLDAHLDRAVLQPFDNTNLNLHPAFAARVPTSENFCIEVFDRLDRVLAAGMLRQVRLEETSNNSFSYMGSHAEPGSGMRKRA